MNEKPESEEFEEDEEETAFEATSEVDFDRLAKDLDAAKKRGQKLGDPAWRKLERRREEKNVAELTSDFDDYDIGVDEGDEDGEGDSAPQAVAASRTPAAIPARTGRMSITR